MPIYTKNGAYQLVNGSLQLGPYEKIIEDFEYNTRSAFENNYSNTFRFDLQSNKVNHGGQAIAHTRTAHNNITSQPGDGLSYYPRISDSPKIRVGLNCNSNSDYAYFSFFKPGYNADSWQMRLDKVNNSIQFVWNFSNGHAVEIDFGHNITTGLYYTLGVDAVKQANGNHSYTFHAWKPNGNKIASQTIVESNRTPEGGGIGFGAVGRCRHDYLRVV